MLIFYNLFVLGLTDTSVQLDWPIAGHSTSDLAFPSKIEAVVLEVPRVRGRSGFLPCAAQALSFGLVVSNLGILSGAVFSFEPLSRELPGTDILDAVVMLLVAVVNPARCGGSWLLLQLVETVPTGLCWSSRARRPAARLPTLARLRASIGS